MGLVDTATKIAGALGIIDDPTGTPPPWAQRLQPSIRFESPKGDRFEFFWIGDNRSVERRVARYNLPYVRGTIAKDLEAAGITYPLTFYASGPNHDLISQKFFKVFRTQPGQWKVSHPTIGAIVLTPISLTHEEQPIESGNITKFTSEWIEAIDPATLKTYTDPSAKTEAEIDAINAANIADAAPLTDYRGPAVLTAARSVGAAVESVNAVFGDIQQTNADINGAMLEAASVAQWAVSTPAIATAQLVGSMQSLFQLPSALKTDLTQRADQFSNATTAAAAARKFRAAESEERLRQYSSLISGMTAALRQDNIAQYNADNRNAWRCVAELSFSAALAGACRVVSGAEIVSRTSAVFFAETLLASFTTAVDFITGNSPDGPCLLSTYGPLSAAVGFAARHAIESAYNVIPERRIVLAYPRAPIEIAIHEMLSEDGDIDQALDSFCAINNLTGRDLLLLPTGREVLINE